MRPILNHFYEKLLLIKERMHTKEGKRIADERDRFMHEYLDRFMKGHGTFEYNYPVAPSKHKWPMVGHHSGMSEDEMRVPLIVY